MDKEGGVTYTNFSGTAIPNLMVYHRCRKSSENDPDVEMQNDPNDDPDVVLKRQSFTGKILSTLTCLQTGGKKEI